MRIVKTAGALLAPSTVSAFAFKHADGLGAERVKYATDDVELGVAVHLSGLFGEFFAPEVHVSPLRERSNKYQTAQTFPGRFARNSL
jgi:hypothetical protein